ncbi:MAG: RNA 3'-terminal phosphate cyclase [Candidatus Bathyarchaeia archaeon]|nr:RNA 3'-terminal phosphate cyclase [Candidatus Bathyarchaeota archaeon]
MIEIDGSQKSGSGTILRLSVALAAITKEPLHIFNIRKKRRDPGLRPQHLEAVLTATRLCNATIKGASLGSEELWFEPDKIVGGKIKAEIGTAGSIPMLILTVLPMCIFAQQPVNLTITKGGTDVLHSPTINYIRFVLLPTLEQMGVKSTLKVNKYGYYPKGMGEVTLEVQPCTQILPYKRTEFGKITEVKGISVCTFLADRNVAARQAKEAERLLAQHGYHPKIEVVNDFSNPLQKGSSLVLWSLTDTNVMLGGDSIGEIQKPSEKVAYEAVKSLLTEIQAKATVDVHLADMLIPFIALAEGESEYLTRMLTDHIESNLWLASTFLGAKFKTEKHNGLYRITKTQ